MNQILATILCIAGILVIFSLVRDQNSRASRALWLPVIWLLINGSRPISMWLQIAPPSTPEQYYLEGSPVDRAVYTLLLLAGLIVLWIRRETLEKILRANPVILVFVFYCAVSIVWSDYPGVAFKRWIKLVADITMVLIVLTDLEPIRALKRVLLRVAFLLIPLSVLLFKYYPDLARYYSRWNGRQFFSGVATDKNMLGMTCLVYGLGVWWQFLIAYADTKGKERRRRLIALGTILAMLLWIFHLADSMTSLFCFIIAAGLMAVTRLDRVRLKSALLHFLVIGVVGGCFGVLILGVGTGSLKMMGRDSTLTGRTEIWKGVLDLSANPFFGVGFESFWLGDRLRRIWAHSEYLNGLNEAHNGYLEVYLNLGWIGVSFITVFIAKGYRNVLAAFRLDQDTASLRLGFLVAAVIYGFTEAAFRIMSPIWIAFLLAVIAVPKTCYSSSPAGAVYPWPAVNWWSRMKDEVQS